MFLFEEDADFVQDREDLLSVLKMRFGSISPGIVQEIYDIKDMDTLERLILVAANAPSLKVFLEEMEEGEGNFKITGERFNPIGSMFDGGG
ncbi:hypothetical protein [Virgibacillus ainsalahensis]